MGNSSGTSSASTTNLNGLSNGNAVILQEDAIANSPINDTNKLSSSKQIMPGVFGVTSSSPSQQLRFSNKFNTIQKQNAMQSGNQQKSKAKSKDSLLNSSFGKYNFSN